MDQVEVGTTKTVRSQRRMGTVAVDKDRLLDLVTGRAKLIIDSLPDGAEMLNASLDFRYDAILITIGHESFDEVPVGEMLPMLDLGARTEFVDAGPARWGGGRGRNVNTAEFVRPTSNGNAPMICAGTVNEIAIQPAKFTPPRARHICADCGLACYSAHGLRRHRNARHGG